MRNELKRQILDTLKEYPRSRNSDQLLTLMIWSKYYPNRIFKNTEDESCMRLKDIMDLPREDSVKRIRAQIQNVELKYLPTSWEVAKQRRINIDDWNKFARVGHFVV